MVGSVVDASSFSYCTDKIMTTGGDGCSLLLRDAWAYARAWSCKYHGKNPHKVMNPFPGNSFRWLHDGFGSNYRMTEMQAAICLVQLEKLPGWLSRRRRHAALLDSLLADAPMLRLAIPPEPVGHPRYNY